MSVSKLLNSIEASDEHIEANLCCSWYKVLEILFPRLLLCYYLTSYFTLCVICISVSVQFCSLLFPQQVNVPVNVLLPVAQAFRC